MSESQPPAIGLLDAGEPAPVAVDNSGAASPFLFVCDHAGRAVPHRLANLGLAPEAFDRHIAWDIGAGAVAAGLGAALDACVIRQRYSRLVIDCNRAPGRADLVVETSDGLPIPGNQGLSRVEIETRIAEIHRPYHAAIAAELDARAARGLTTLLVLVHSFTPALAGGPPRPWHMGVLHAGNSAASKAMLDLLRQEGDLVVGDNEPYAMDEVDYTAPLHAGARGLDYLELEIRQDLIADPAGQANFVQRLARLAPRLLADDRTGREPGF